MSVALNNEMYQWQPWEAYERWICIETDVQKKSSRAKHEKAERMNNRGLRAMPETLGKGILHAKRPEDANQSNLGKYGSSGDTPISISQLRYSSMNDTFL